MSFETTKIGFARISDSTAHSVTLILPIADLEKAIALVKKFPDPMHKDSPALILWAKNQDFSALMAGTGKGVDLNLVDPSKPRKK